MKKRVRIILISAAVMLVMAVAGAWYYSFVSQTIYSERITYQRFFPQAITCSP